MPRPPEISGRSFLEREGRGTARPISAQKKSARYEKVPASRFTTRLQRVRKNVRGGADLHRYVRWRWRKKAAGSPARQKLRQARRPHALSPATFLKSRRMFSPAPACR